MDQLVYLVPKPFQSYFKPSYPTRLSYRAKTKRSQANDNKVDLANVLIQYQLNSTTQEQYIYVYYICLNVMHICEIRHWDTLTPVKLNERDSDIKFDTLCTCEWIESVTFYLTCCCQRRVLSKETVFKHLYLIGQTFPCMCWIYNRLALYSQDDYEHCLSLARMTNWAVKSG